MSIFENSYTRTYDAMRFRKDQRKVEVLSESIFINSQDAERTGTGRFRCSLPQEYRSITSARLLSAEIPHSFYNFSGTLSNNILSLSSGDVVITPAIYTNQTLVDAIDSSTPLTAAFDASTGRCTLTSPTDTTLYTNRLAKALGFDVDTLLPAGQGVVGSLCVNPHTIPYLLLSIDKLNQTFHTIASDTSGTPQVFAKVWLPTSTTAFQYTFYDKKFSETTVSPPQTLNKLDIQWLTPDLRPVDFNGFPSSFTLELFCTTSQRPF